MYTQLTDNPQIGAQLLASHNFVEVSSTESDTFRRKVYEVETDEGTEVWIERESKLEAPEYFYHLDQFVGEVS